MKGYTMIKRNIIISIAVAALAVTGSAVAVKNDASPKQTNNPVVQSTQTNEKQPDPITQKEDLVPTPIETKLEQTEPVDTPETPEPKPLPELDEYISTVILKKLNSNMCYDGSRPDKTCDYEALTLLNSRCFKEELIASKGEYFTTTDVDNLTITYTVKFKSC